MSTGPRPIGNKDARAIPCGWHRDDCAKLPFEKVASSCPCT